MHKSRKEKSLRLLCVKFLNCYPMHPKPDEKIYICLDSVTARLKIEKRRIYDIVNILESVEIVSRVRKNQYQWHGFNQLKKTISKLNDLSLKSKFLQETKACMNSDFSKKTPFLARTDESESSVEKSKCDELEDLTKDIFNREERSLPIMTQKFLMLFLNSKDGLVSINFAGRFLQGNYKNYSVDEGKLKTKIRRLYDIANILSSLDLIEKFTGDNVSVSKPAYRYIGPKLVKVVKSPDLNTNHQNIEIDEESKDATNVISCFQNSDTQLQLQNLFSNYTRNLEQIRLQIQNQTYLNMVHHQQTFFYNSICRSNQHEVSRLSDLEYQHNEYSQSINKFYPITNNMLTDFSFYNNRLNPRDSINQMNLSYLNSLLN